MIQCRITNAINDAPLRSPPRAKINAGIDLISEVLPSDPLWYGGPEVAANAIGYAMHSSPSHDAVIRVYDAAEHLIEVRKHADDFKQWRARQNKKSPHREV